MLPGRIKGSFELDTAITAIQVINTRLAHRIGVHHHGATANGPPVCELVTDGSRQHHRPQGPADAAQVYASEGRGFSEEIGLRTILLTL